MTEVETLDTSVFRSLVTSIGILPSAYTEAMSYYELVAWLCNYVEKNIVTNLNNHAQAIKEIQEWINTLEIQDEVNEKLSAMAESGELQELMASYLDANTTWTFDTVADMQAATNLIEGSYARTLGYTTLNDKCGGLYKVVSTETSIALQNDLYAEYVVDDATYTLDDFDGETPEDKLITALNTITNGTIIGGNITLTKVYTATDKDYRQIKICDATITLEISGWFDQTNSSYTTVPIFESCTFIGNGHTLFTSGANCVGPLFNSCSFNGDICIYANDSNYFLQSPYFIGCQLHGVNNLFTAYNLFDFKMVGCRVESASGTLVKVAAPDGIRQGSVDSTLIEGRTNEVFDLTSIYGLTISKCYFEACNGGVVHQRGGSSAPAFLTFIDNVVYAPMNNVDYVIRTDSAGYQNMIIRNNVTNLPSGKYLCDKYIEETDILNYHNVNYSNPSGFENNGFVGWGDNGAYNKLRHDSISATWNSTNSTWDISFYLPYSQAYNAVSPYLVSFVGSFQGTSVYRGYANILVTPRVGYITGVTLLVDATILNSCNKNGQTPTSDVTATAELSSSAYNTTEPVKVTLHISGFTEYYGKASVMDMMRIVSFEHKFLNA